MEDTDYHKFIEEVHEDENQVYLSQNYIDPSKAKRINEIEMSLRMFKTVNEKRNLYWKRKNY